MFKRFKEAGRRHSASDQKMVQTVHDHAVSLGADCGMDEAEREPIVHPGVDAVCAEAEMSYNDITNVIRMALKSGYPGTNTYIYVRDVYPDAVVYEVSGDGTDTNYKRSYSLLDGTVTFGDAVKVVAVTNYVPVSEATEIEEFTSDLVPLTEAKALGKDGVARVKVISPGQGSSGYYSPKVLEAAAAKFANAQCFWDHPTATDETNRPERSLRDLAGKIVGTPTWEAKGATGPGIYADVQVFKPYQDSVQELASHIGMSIRALGKAGTAEVEGKKVRSIESIDDVRSVDFVTVPGRGGEILQLFESARGGANQQPERVDDVKELEEAQGQIKTLTETITAQGEELARLRTESLGRDAHAIVVDALAEANLPGKVRVRLTTQLSANPPLKDGALDRESLATRITEAVKAATEEITEVAESFGGSPVRGMGGGDTPKEEDAHKALVESFKAAGHSADVAERMAAL